MAFGDPGSGSDLALYDKFLKEWYMSKWIDLLNNLTTTYKLSRKRIVNFQGRRMIIALRTARTGAVGALPVSGFVAAGGSSPTSYGTSSLMEPAYQGVNNAMIRPKLVMGAIGLPQDVIDVSTSDKGAFYEVVDFEMQGLKTDMANYLDKLMYSGGTELSPIVSSGTETTFVPQNAAPFHVGQRLEFWTTPTIGATLRSGVGAQVSAIDNSTREVTVDTTVSGLIGGDHVYTTGARDANTSYEPLGFQEIVKESAASVPTATAGDLLLNNYEGNNHLYGIGRETADATSPDIPEWSSSLVDADSAELEFRQMHQVLDDVHDASGGDPTVFLTTRTTRRQITRKMAYPTGQSGAGAQATQNFMNTTQLKGGFIGRREDHHGQGGSDWVLFDDRLPIVVDRYATHDFENNLGTLYAIDSRHCFWALVTDWRWWAPEGRILREATSASGPQFGVLAHAYLFGEHVVDSPNTCGRIYDILTTNT